MRDSKRGTGRTTRMLSEAVKAARAGRVVYVIGSSRRHISELRRMSFVFAGNYDSSGIKFETPHSLGDFDFRTMRMPGAHPNCKIFIDHYTIEYIFSAMLKELHRYDLEE